MCVHAYIVHFYFRWQMMMMMILMKKIFHHIHSSFVRDVSLDFILKVYLLIILVPFVFISPTDYRTQVVVDDNQTTSELLNEKKTNEGEEESGGM